MYMNVFLLKSDLTFVQATKIFMCESYSSSLEQIALASFISMSMKIKCEIKRLCIGWKGIALHIINHTQNLMIWI